jgi:hypothetical protein
LLGAVGFDGGVGDAGLEGGVGVVGLLDFSSWEVWDPGVVLEGGLREQEDSWPPAG